MDKIIVLDSCSLISFKIDQRIRLVEGSMPEVGSSRIIVLEGPMMAMAMERRLFQPPESSYGEEGLG